MRRMGSDILVGVGAFLLLAALLLRFYAYPRLAVAPVDQSSLTTLQASNATIFDAATLKPVTSDLFTTVKTTGDTPAARKQGHNTVVWVSTSSTKSADGEVRSRSVDRVAFDATTGMAVNCCGEYYETVDGQPQEVKHRGLVFKFPFRTEKKSYPWWDGNLLEAPPISYVGTTKIKGVVVYKFEQTIPRTKTGTIDVPASLVGLAQTGTVRADETYSNVRTLWVEPNTGAVVNRVEQQKSTLAYQGQDRLTTTEATSGYNDATVAQNAARYGPQGRLLDLLHGLVPLVAGLLGLAMVVVGLLTDGVLRRRR